MRSSKNSQPIQQSWGFLLTIVLLITTLSFLVLLLMGMGITGFAILNPLLPSNVSLSLDLSSYPEGSILEGDVAITLEGPVATQTSYSATLDGNTSSLSLLTALDMQALSYELSEPNIHVDTTSSSLTLFYPSAGAQRLVFRLPRSVTLQGMSFNLHGLDNAGSYPSFLKIDANSDGVYEWEYVGDFIDFNDTFFLPSGLNENQESTISITEQNAYYCELFSLPRSKDFLVSAKYKPLQTNSSADLEIALFSATGSASSMIGTGGTDVCDLEETSTATPEYHSCRLTLSYAVSGNYLVCAHNAGLQLPAGEYYSLSRDIDQHSGYRCTKSNGRLSCASQLGDFFIKVQQADYEGVVDRRILLSEGSPSALLPAKLNEQLHSCTPYDGFCYLPLDIASDTQGSLYLDNLDLVYSDQGTVVHEHNFYTLTSDAQVISSIDNKDLTSENMTLTLPLELLQLQAPTLRSNLESKNYTLQVRFDPGPSTTSTLIVTRNNETTNLTFTGNFSEDIPFYQQLFTSFLQENHDLLVAGGYLSRVQSALTTLSHFASANDTFSESSFLANISELPQSFSVVSSSSFVPSVSTSDFQDIFLYPEERTAPSKQQLAYLQKQYAPTVQVKVIETLLFNQQKQTNTLLSYSASAPFSSGKMIVLFPQSFSSSLSSISFSQQPDTTLSTTPLIVSWDSSSLSGTFSFLVSGNVLSMANTLRILFIPENIPDQTEPARSTCGDGVCSVLVTGDQRIYLEDAISCPVDCKGRGSSLYSTFFIVLIALLLIYYFGGMYKGRWNVHHMLATFKKQPSKSQTSKPSKLFSSAADEQNLYAYVQNALKKGAKEKELTATLLNRGWTKQQVDSIMKQAKP